MHTIKKIGVWMDYAEANLIDVNKDVQHVTIHSEFNHHMKQEALERSERIMHNKEHHLHEAYFNEIAEHLLNYNEVLLFGPTQAKFELRNFLNKQHNFHHIRINIETADKMSAHDKTDFVQKHFNTSPV
jgi:stalled ribosome rescue protein Dom34